MHFAITTLTAILAASTTVLAAPAASPSTCTSLSDLNCQSLPDDPQAFPINVEDLTNGVTMDCGGTIYDEFTIYRAVQWGTLLQNAGIARGKKSTQFPKGRFPHSYTGTQYTFNGDCPEDDNRQEYPLISPGPYNGGLYNNQWGPDRVVYYREPGQIGQDGHDLVYFCGGLTHTGAASGKFLQCTVK